MIVIQNFFFLTNTKNQNHLINMSNRNNLVELERFIYSLLVVGYHVQAAYASDKTFFFENGANAVEFFFVVSGYFFARSIEKVNSKEEKNVFYDTFEFMKNKIKTIFVAHIVISVIMMLFGMIVSIQSFPKMLLNGLPGLFLIQMAICWKDSMGMTFCIPEWYISTMLLCMLVMAPTSFLLRRKLSGIWIPVILFAFNAVVVGIVAFCTKFNMNETYIDDARGWAELCVGMFSYHMSVYISTKEFSSNLVSVTFKIIEMIAYHLPVVLGFVPINKKYMPLIMSITAFLAFVALSITFGNKGIIVKNKIINAVFGYLGSISLPIYLFHTFFVGFFYTNDKIAIWIIFMVVFLVSIIVSIIYKLIYDGIKKCISKIKEKKMQNVYTESLIQTA